MKIIIRRLPDIRIDGSRAMSLNLKNSGKDRDVVWSWHNMCLEMPQSHLFCCCWFSWRPNDFTAILWWIMSSRSSQHCSTPVLPSAIELHWTCIYYCNYYALDSGSKIRGGVHYFNYSDIERFYLIFLRKQISGTNQKSVEIQWSNER